MEHLKQALVFLVGQRRYAMDILHLKEVCRMPSVEPVSNPSPGVLGVVRMHGQPVEVFDMATLLDVRQPDSDAPDRGLARPWIVVGHTAGGETHWRVDAVEDIIEIDPDRVLPGDGGDAPEILDLGGGLTHLLTPELLCARAVK